MKCSNCGGELIFNNGVGICESCNSTYRIENVFENIDVCLCYIENDENGRRTKDSIIAGEVYKKLESKKINCFYRIKSKYLPFFGKYGLFLMYNYMKFKS